MEKHEKQFLNEKEWLGIVLKSPSLWNEKHLNKSHFYNKRHESLYELIDRFVSKRIPLDSSAWVTLTESELESIGGVEYIQECKRLAYNLQEDNVKRLEKDIQTYHIGIQLHEQLVQIEQSEHYDLEQIRESVQRINESVEGISSKRKTLQEILNETYQDWMNMTDELSGMDTGYESLNSNFDGWQTDNADLLIVGARPSVGKTATTINLMLRSAKKGGRVIYVATETGDKSIAKRGAAIIANLPVNKMRNPNKFLNAQELKRLEKAMEEFNQLPIHIADFKDVHDIVQYVREVRRDYPNDKILVIIDHMSQLDISSVKHNNVLNIKYGAICKVLKAMNKRYKVGTMLLSQLNRESAKSDNKRPNLTSLRDSGEIEQDADVVLLLHREMYYKRQSGEEINPNEKDVLEIIIAKNRDGECGVLEFEFVAETNEVKEL